MNLILITLSVCAIAFAVYVWRSHEAIAERKAEAKLAKWKLKEEKAIREDAYQRSRAVSFGKTIEHYDPFMENFPIIQKGRVYWHEYNAKGIWEHETKDEHLNKEIK